MHEPLMLPQPILLLWRVILALFFAGAAPGLVACSPRAATPGVNAVPSAPAAPPAPPALPGLAVAQLPEPVFGGSYALLSVGPLAPSLVEHEPLPPLLLVHGLGHLGMADFYPVLETLAQDRQVLAVDLPGFGASTRGNFAYRPESFAAFLAYVIDVHAHGQSDVAGHSLGGAVSLALAGRYPSKVRRLALLDAAGILFRETLVYEMQNEFGDEPEADLFRLVGRDLWNAALAVASPFSPDPNTVLDSEFLRGEVLDGDPMRIAALALLEHNFDAELRAVRAPTLLVWGKGDATAPLRTFHVLKERLPVWESALLEGVGHNPMMDAPSQLASRLVPFFSEAHLGPFENKRPGVVPLQQARCDGQPVRTFEGRFERLEIRGCRQVLIKNAVVESLFVLNSNVELRQVTVEQGTQVRDANLRATGSLLLGETALQVDASNVDLAGVEVAGTQTSLRVLGKSTVVASVSGLATNDGRLPLHGRVKWGGGTTR